MNPALPNPVVATQAPLPDLSVLKDLSPGVAYATLAAIVTVTLLLYLGPGLRARLTKDPPKPDPPIPAGPAPTTALPQAMDRADLAYSQFIDHLLRRENAAAERIEQLEHENETLRDELGRLNRLLWQRGPS